MSLYLTLVGFHGPSWELVGLPHNKATHSETVGFLVAQMVKNSPAMQETRVQSLGQEDPLEKGNGNPLQYSYLENLMDGGPWWAKYYIEKNLIKF